MKTVEYCDSIIVLNVWGLGASPCTGTTVLVELPVLIAIWPLYALVIGYPPLRMDISSIAKDGRKAIIIQSI